jgi:hypothetical protein
MKTVIFLLLMVSCRSAYIREPTTFNESQRRAKIEERKRVLRLVRDEILLNIVRYTLFPMI